MRAEILTAWVRPCSLQAHITDKANLRPESAVKLASAASAQSSAALPSLLQTRMASLTHLPPLPTATAKPDVSARAAAAEYDTITDEDMHLTLTSRWVTSHPAEPFQ